MKFGGRSPEIQKNPSQRREVEISSSFEKNANEKGCALRCGR